MGSWLTPSASFYWSVQEVSKGQVPLFTILRTEGRTKLPLQVRPQLGVLHTGNSAVQVQPLQLPSLPVPVQGSHPLSTSLQLLRAWMRECWAPEFWRAPAPYPAHLALCAVVAVLSLHPVSRKAETKSHPSWVPCGPTYCPAPAVHLCFKCQVYLWTPIHPAEPC